MACKRIRTIIALITCGQLVPAIAGYSAEASASVRETYPSVQMTTSLASSTFSRFGSLGGFLGMTFEAARGVASFISADYVRNLPSSVDVAPAGIRPEAASLTPKPGSTSGANVIAGDAAFGSVAVPFKRLAALGRLAPALKEMKDGASFDCPRGCSSAAVAIRNTVGEIADAPLRDKLNHINAAVNVAIRYRPDIETYNVNDNWATPSEALSRQEGDCEDYAILKMAALRAAGIDDKDMAIVVLFDQKRRFYHAVLSVSVGNRHYILDNLRNQVLADRQLPDYLPLYSIAAGKGYLHGSRIAANQKVASAVPIDGVAPGEGANLQ